MGHARDGFPGAPPPRRCAAPLPLSPAPQSGIRLIAGLAPGGVFSAPRVAVRRSSVRGAISPPFFYKYSCRRFAWLHVGTRRG